jgi:hypothetical protein
MKSADSAEKGRYRWVSNVVILTLEHEITPDEFKGTAFRKKSNMTLEEQITFFFLDNPLKNVTRCISGE